MVTATRAGGPLQTYGCGRSSRRRSRRAGRRARRGRTHARLLWRGRPYRVLETASLAWLFLQPHQCAFLGESAVGAAFQVAGIIVPPRAAHLDLFNFVEGAHPQIGAGPPARIAVPVDKTAPEHLDQPGVQCIDSQGIVGRAHRVGWVLNVWIGSVDNTHLQRWWVTGGQPLRAEGMTAIHQ